MILLKGKEKSTIVDISDDELKAMHESWVADTQMSKALLGLSDEQFNINVVIPKGLTVKVIKDQLRKKLKIIEKTIEEFNKKLQYGGS